MKNKAGFMAEQRADGIFLVSTMNKLEGNEEQLLAASPLILAAAEWAFRLLQDLDDYYCNVKGYLNEKGLVRWAEYVKAIRQVDLNEPLLPRER